MSFSTRMPGSWTPSDFDEELDEDVTPPHILSTTIELDKSQPPTPDGSGLPVNFHTIGPGLFRSSFPLPSHFPALESFGFKTIITLVPGETPPATKAFIAKHHITHYQIHVVANKDPEVYASDETISKIIRIMLNRDNHPILIHCNKGKHRTGCVTAIFRKCTGWPLDACIAEYEKYAKPKCRDLDKAFITRFDVSELKILALQEGFVTRAFAPPYSVAASSNASAYTNATMESVESTTTLNHENLDAALSRAR